MRHDSELKFHVETNGREVTLPPMVEDEFGDSHARHSRHGLGAENIFTIREHAGGMRADSLRANWPLFSLTYSTVRLIIIFRSWRIVKGPTVKPSIAPFAKTKQMRCILWNCFHPAKKKNYQVRFLNLYRSVLRRLWFLIIRKINVILSLHSFLNQSIKIFFYKSYFYLLI